MFERVQYLDVQTLDVHLCVGGWTSCGSLSPLLLFYWRWWFFSHHSTKSAATPVFACLPPPPTADAQACSLTYHGLLMRSSGVHATSCWSTRVLHLPPGCCFTCRNDKVSFDSSCYYRNDFVEISTFNLRSTLRSFNTNILVSYGIN